MKRKYKNRRAFTLAELSIALAVIAILTVMVASFTTLVRQNTARSTEQLNALEEIELVESLVENWLENNAESVDDIDDSDIFDETTRTLKIGGSVQLSTVEHITFDIRSNDGGDTLYICKIEYVVASTTRYYTFCVNPYVGEEVSP